MKREWLTLIVVATIGIVAGDLLARGGGGRVGGGGGGGGARVGGGGGAVSRPSPAAGRSPSMSRPSTGAANRPQAGSGAGPRPGTGAVTRPTPGGGAATRPATRPTQGQLNNFLDVPRPSTGVAGSGSALRPGAGGAAADFLHEGSFARPSTLPATRPGAGNIASRPGAESRPGVDNRQDRRQGFADNRPTRVENRQQLQDNRGQRRDELRGQVATNYPRLDFWTDHPNWAAWRINRPYRWATWALITPWLGYGSAAPVYYNYCDNFYYQDGAVYNGDTQVATADEYAEQATVLATSAPDTKPEDSEWMPLGVFALTQDGEASGSPPSLFVQLAISKEGVISGNLDNKSTGKTEAIEGMADKKSQRVAWCVKGKQAPIVETGLSNLTQDTVPALIHFADGQTQQWLMVRLEEPMMPK